jgi:hypothetical protein
MPKNAQKCPQYAHNMPKNQQGCYLKSRFSPSSGPFQIAIWVIFPVSGLQKMPKNAQKCPKMSQNVPKHVQKPSGIIFENIDFWRFFDLYDPYSVIFGSGRVLGGLQKCQKMPKNAK